MSETDLSRAIREALTRLGVTITRHQCGTIFLGGRVLQLGESGWPDIIGFMPDGRFVGIEVKAPKGRKRDKQEQWAEKAKAAGCVVGTVRSVAEAVALVQRARKERAA